MSEQKPQMEVTAQTFTVGVEHLPDLETKLKKLVARAQRLGVGTLAWEFGPERVEETKNEETGETVSQLVSDVMVVGETPKVQGYTFVAKLDHTDHGNIVRAFGDYEMPEWTRTAKAYCIHCGKTRKRASTYILRSEDGKLVQVGSSCLKDFLGHSNPIAFAAYLTLLEALGKEASEASFRSKRTTVLPVQTFVAFAMLLADKDGFKPTSLGAGSTAAQAAEMTASWMTAGQHKAPERFQPSEPYVKEAARALEWIREAKIEGDYLLNLQTAAKAEYATRKTKGLLASIPVAWKRHLEELERDAEKRKRPVFGPSKGWVGTLGEKSTLKLRYERRAHFDVQGRGRYTERIYLHVMRDEQDRAVVWKTTHPWLPAAAQEEDGSWSPVQIEPEAGEEVQLVCTVSKHDFYQGEHQTTVQRCKALIPAPDKSGKGKPEQVTGEAAIRAKIAKAQKALEKTKAAIAKMDPYGDLPAWQKAQTKYEKELRALGKAQSTLQKHLHETSAEGSRLMAAEANLREIEKKVTAFLEHNDNNWDGEDIDWQDNKSHRRQITYPAYGNKGWTARNQIQGRRYSDELRRLYEQAREELHRAKTGAPPSPDLDIRTEPPAMVSKDEANKAALAAHELAVQLKGLASRMSSYEPPETRATLLQVLDLNSKVQDADEHSFAMSYAHRKGVPVDDDRFLPLLDAARRFERARDASATLFAANSRHYADEPYYVPSSHDAQGRFIPIELVRAAWRTVGKEEYEEMQQRLNEDLQQARKDLREQEAAVGIKED